MNLDRGLQLVHQLKDCAMLTESCKFIDANVELYRISHLASPDGDSMQRVATYFNEALACSQVVKLLHGAPKVLHLSNKLSTPEQLLVHKFFFEMYPFLKIAYMTTSQAIIEAMEQEKTINILDFNACDATQWIYLMQSLKGCLTNPQYLKITITCIHEKKEVLEKMDLDLRLEAQRLNFSDFKFNPILSTLENLDLETLPIKKGEPLAISCVLQLHSLLATTGDHEKNNNQRAYAQILVGKQKKKKTNNILSPDSALSPILSLSPPKMECFLYGLWKLQPKVMVITEQEANVNGPTLIDRFDKALHFYGALFDCLECTLSRTLVNRILLEKMFLGEQIKNIISCEGVERKERYEKIQTWIPRLELAGFGRVPISSNGLMQAKNLLQSYVHGYRVVQDNKCLFICWKDTPLFSVSAWRF